MRLRLGFLASHGGSNVQAIIDACRARKLDAEPRVIICNNSDAQVFERARRAGVATRHLSSHTHPSPDALDAAILQTLIDHDVNLVVLAGYMRKLGPRTLSHYRGRVLNIHPALLPKFGGKGMYGRRVHEAVLAARERESGATVHIVTEEYDKGAIVAHLKVRVMPNDTPDSLAARVLDVEHALYRKTLAKIARGTIKLPSDPSDRPSRTKMPAYEPSIRFPLSGQFGFAPQITAILEAVDDHISSHNFYKLRHPADSFAVVSSELGYDFLSVLHLVESLEREGAELRANEESVRLYAGLLMSFFRYFECAYEVLVALSDKRRFDENDRKVPWRWLSKQNLCGGHIYYSIVRHEIDFFRKVHNVLKHSSDRLRPVTTALVGRRPCLGYYVESSIADGIVGPSDLSDVSPNGQRSANSFNRDLRRLYYSTYLVADALRRAVIIQGRLGDAFEPASSASDDSMWKEMHDLISALPQAYFQKEAGKPVPIAIRSTEDSKHMMNFSMVPAPITYGSFRVSTMVTASREGKYQLPLP
ncbi:MAG: phosphoribosylglycinamide formyltransferase [Candidatus Binataceae bacterium]